MKIGRIVYNSELVNHKLVDYIEYIKQENPIFYDDEIPTLYVGWSYLKRIKDNELIQAQYIDNKTIITNKIFWEFEFSEMKSEHVSGVDEFKNNLPSYYFNNNYKTINVDPIFLGIHDVKSLFEYLPKENNNVYQYENKGCYILNNNMIYCLNFNVLNFYKFNIDDVLNRIKLTSSSYNLDENGDLYVKYKRIFSQFDDLKRFIVVFLN